MDLGRRLQALRVARGISQAGLARASGLSSQGTISEIESGKRDPQVGTLEKIVAALDMSLSEFFRQDLGSIDNLTSFWRLRFATLGYAENEAMKNSPTQRSAWAMQQLLEAFGAAEVKALIGQPEHHLQQIAAGQLETNSAIQRLLAERARVDWNWLQFGELPLLDKNLQEFLQHDSAGAYLTEITRAMKHDIIPDVLARQIDVLIMAKGHNKPPVT
jgi:transcriptional regulator with XRE-family HTH domain